MKITVVTVNRDGDRYLAEAMASVLVQETVDLEYLLIDGASADRSLEIIGDFASRDARVVWHSAPDQGIADAMNRGLEAANGEIVGFLHSDDRYPHPGVLKLVAAAFDQNPGAVWLTGGVDFINSRGDVIRSYPPREYDFRRLVRSNLIFHPATFVRASALRRQRFDTGLRYAMDYDLWLRLGEECAPLVLPETLACFRVHPSSCSLRAADAALAEEFAIRRRFLNRNGRAIWPYYIDYLLKRPLHRLFMAKLVADAARNGEPCRG